MKYKELIDTLISLTFNLENKKLSTSDYIISKSIQVIINSMFIWVIKRGLSKEDRTAFIDASVQQVKRQIIKKLKPSNVPGEDFYLEINKLMKEAKNKLYNILIK